MMRSLNIMNASDLPLTRNMPFASNSVPSKNQQPRNMTGIYLGLEGNSKPPTRTTIPPLARGRGMSTRIRTPTEQRRYKMVEQLRIKEEKRGFVGQPVKTSRKKESEFPPIDQRKKSAISPDNPESPRFNHHQTTPRTGTAKQWGPGKSVDKTEFFDLVRTNPRNYTVVVNNGVTRSENLSGLMSFAIDSDGNMNAPLSDMLAEEVHRISFTQHTHDQDSDMNALEECYKKVCRGKIESLQSLLPYRKNQQRHSAHYSTGFTVRSYRNPNQADIMADFSDTGPGRPKTVPASLQRPIVPSPYFFRHYNSPYTAKQTSATSAKSSRKVPPPGFEDQFSALNGTTKVLASPGAGILTRSLNSRKSAWSESDIKLNKKLHGTPGDSTDDLAISEIKDTLKESSLGNTQQTKDLPADTNTTDTAEDNTTSGQTLSPSEHTHITVPVDQNQESQAESERSKGKMELGSSGKDSIIVGVQNEDGKDDAVEIDSNEDEMLDSEAPMKGNLRKASISEKVEKFRESEAYIATIKENAEQRKKQFERMLSEHAELVEEIGRATAPDAASDDRDH